MDEQSGAWQVGLLTPFVKNDDTKLSHAICFVLPALSAQVRVEMELEWELELKLKRCSVSQRLWQLALLQQCCKL